MINFKINLKQGFRIFILMLFLMSMAVPPVIARIPGILIVQTQQDGLQLTQQAQAFYQSGQFEKAVQFWQKAAEILAQNGDQLNHVMA
ncbi:tetratricopeptide repeat protein [Lyngbya sp. PCC 8106]|uniref:tetratricopeptide repeat protein n=1 Tax=Lyngbya sp. (strain PCC 8106) TaxID=313612 RepID=UPI0000EACE0C|nr:tetratricopeptide repeat protein [Lyngbya sp. PCC 8106]EAW34793.1 hypothetical protein L8106_26262 [Lyngbya sp. PCC 8106]